MRGFCRWLTLIAALGLWPLSAGAQNIGGPLDPGVIQSPILVIEFERVFSESAFGQRFSREAEAAGAEIAAQNRRIEAELIEEERSLTEQRKTMEPAAFRALADAFDEKVERLRAEQEAKARSLGQRSEEERRRFLAAARPVLEGLMSESGAAMILEARAVFVAADTIDITDLAIQRIDQAIGDGAVVAPEPVPAPLPDPVPIPAPEDNGAAPQDP